MISPWFLLGIVLGLGAIIVGCVGLSFGFKDFGSPDNNIRWRAMGTLLAAVVLFIIAWGVMIYGHFKSKKMPSKKNMSSAASKFSKSGNTFTNTNTGGTSMGLESLLA